MHNLALFARKNFAVLALILSITAIGIGLLTKKQTSANEPSIPHWQDMSWETSTYDNPTINDLVFISPEHGWALTPFHLFETNDGGISWKSVLTGDGKRVFSSVFFPDSKSGWLVGASMNKSSNAALILHTTDGGKSWSEQHISNGSKLAATGLYSISQCSSTVLWAAGENAIIRTIDGGQNWETQYVDANHEFIRDIACINLDRAIAVGFNGLILYTQDRGKSWNRQVSGVTTHLLKVRYFDGEVWAVGTNGVLLRASDADLKWEHHQKLTSETLYDIFMDGEQGWSVGAHGTILNTTDKGLTWQKQQSPTSLDLTSLYFVSPYHGWAGGNGLTFLRYSN